MDQKNPKSNKDFEMDESSEESMGMNKEEDDKKGKSSHDTEKDYNDPESGGMKEKEEDDMDYNDY